MASTDVVITPITPPGKALQANLVNAVAYTPTSGSSGWQIVDRPRRKSGTQWYGEPLWQLTLPLILDLGGPSVEGQCAQIESWVAAPSGKTQAPVLKITGPMPGTQRQWVLSAPSFDEAAVIRDRNGQRTQQSVSLVLYEYAPLAVSLTGPKTSPAKTAQAAAKAAGATPTAKGSYVVKQGDTLSSIAGAKLGNWADWPKIAALNHLRDPNALVVGQRLAMP